MPRKNKRKKKDVSDNKTNKLTFKQLEEEINNSTLFWSILAHLKKMKEYKTDVNKTFMSLNEFEAAINEFEKLKIYKNDNKTEKRPVEPQTPTKATTIDGNEGDV